MMRHHLKKVEFSAYLYEESLDSDKRIELSAIEQNFAVVRNPDKPLLFGLLAEK
jgi:hypothetical protein